MIANSIEFLSPDAIRQIIFLGPDAIGSFVDNPQILANPVVGGG